MQSRSYNVKDEGWDWFMVIFVYTEINREKSATYKSCIYFVHLFVAASDVAPGAWVPDVTLINDGNLTVKMRLTPGKLTLFNKYYVKVYKYSQDGHQFMKTRIVEVEGTCKQCASMVEVSVTKSSLKIIIL